MGKDLAKPKPKRDLSEMEMQSFVEEGLGVDKEIKKNVFKDFRAKGSTTRLTIDLPEELHTEFKLACVKSKRKMNEEIRNMIARHLEDMRNTQ